MAAVMTVGGPVPATDLGTTLVHEHVLFDLGTYYAPPDDPPGGVEEGIRQDLLWWHRAHPMNSMANLMHDDVELAVTEVDQYVDAGGLTIVDQTVEGIGPRPRELLEVSKRTGAQVVAGTGFYIAGSYRPEVADRPVSALADHLRAELIEGVGGSGVRAGMIGELGVSAPVLPFEHRLLEAAAQVQAELDCAVAIHTPWGDGGVLQAASAAEAAGLNPDRTALCHLDNRFGEEVDGYLEVARRGFWLSLDCFGRDCFYPHLGIQLPSDAVRIGAVSHLLELGLEDRILLSQDICFGHELVANGGHGYAHLLRTIVPRLRVQGVEEDVLQHMLVHNPRAWLAG